MFERFVGKGEAKRDKFNIVDLNDFGCPKFPGKIHNPMDEIMFFMDHIMNHRYLFP